MIRRIFGHEISISRLCLRLEQVFSISLLIWVITCICKSSQPLIASAAACSPVLSGRCLPRNGTPAAGSSQSSSSSPTVRWYDLGQKTNMAEDTWTSGGDCDPIVPESTTNAIVLYTPPILETFHRSARTFHLAGRDFSIKQNWADFGVAAVVWDAAVVLCEYLEKETKTRHLSLGGKRVIELGAGTGLVGMVAAQLKGHLTITDRASTFKPLRDNILLNFSPSSPSVPSSSSSNTNAPSPEISPTSPLSMPKVKVLEWGKNLHRFSEPFDVILGADIIYIEDTFQDLLQTLLHLSNEETLILLSCRIRYERDNHFLDMVKEEFKVEHVLHDSKRGIEIYSAKRKF